MVRYFINYEDFLENNKLNEELDIDSPRLFIIKKYKKIYCRFEPILYFCENRKDLLSFAKKINYSKKGILMVELMEDEINKFDDLFIKKYIQVNDKDYKKCFDNENNKIIPLINFNSIINMDISEINKGNLVAMMPCLSDEDNFYISADRGALSRETSLIDRRRILQKIKLGCDIYFHTTDENILENYKHDITEVKEIDFHKYKLINHKVFVIDAIKNTDLIGFSRSNYYCLDMILQDSIPVYITNNSFGYLLDIEQPNNYQSKGYILNSINFNRLLQNENILPLLKYINVYELDNKVYKKTSLEDYLEKKDTLKYLKKKNTN